jgi:hypothetical protein
MLSLAFFSSSGECDLRGDALRRRRIAVQRGVVQFHLRRFDRIRHVLFGDSAHREAPLLCAEQLRHRDLDRAITAFDLGPADDLLQRTPSGALMRIRMLRARSEREAPSSWAKMLGSFSASFT